MIYYVLLFVGMVVEGPILTIMSGFLASPAGGVVLSLPILYFVVVLSDITGDTIYYLIGHFGRRTFLKTLILRWRGRGEDLAFLEKYFQKHGGKTLLAAKVTHGIGWPILIAAGSARMPYKRFIAINTVVSLFKSAVLLSAGYFCGESYVVISRYVSYGGLIMTLIFIPIFLLVWRGFLSKSDH